MRIPTALMIAASLAAPGVAGEARAQGSTTLHRLPEPAGTARLVLPGTDGGPVPLVIVLPDSLGDESRSETYVLELEARGIATLVLGLDGDPELPQSATDPAASAEAAGIARSWALHALPMVQDGLIGFLGLGAGGRAALAVADAGPVVALYPNCDRLRLPLQGAVLVVHGLAAPDATACAALSPGSAATVHGMPGLGHAWDARAGGWGQGDWLPDPAGDGRMAATPDMEGTARAAELATAWLMSRFVARLEQAR